MARLRSAWGSLLVGLGLLLGAATSCRDHEDVEEVALDSGGTAAMEFGQCEPGEQLPCTCANGASGQQLCLDSGYERAACMCDSGSPPAPPAGTAGPGSDGAGESSGSGGTGGGQGSSGSSG